MSGDNTSYVWSGKPDDFEALYAWAGDQGVNVMESHTEDEEYALFIWNANEDWHEVPAGATIEKGGMGLFILATAPSDVAEAYLQAESDALKSENKAAPATTPVETKPATKATAPAAPAAAPTKE